MHEVSVMSSIIRCVLEELNHYRVKRVKELNMVVGELTFLGEDQLRFAYEILTKGTLLEGAELIIEKEEVIIRCPACGFEGPANRMTDESFHFMTPVLACPICNNHAEIVKGKSCSVTSIRVEEY
ncbi:MAG: hydrogenase maturation nickel metallochaperone HypA [Methanomassiliicoccales archaeon]